MNSKIGKKTKHEEREQSERWGTAREEKNRARGKEQSQWKGTLRDESLRKWEAR